METIAEKIHAGQFQKVREVIQSLEAGDTQQAASLAKAITERLPASATSPEEIQTLFFIEAIKSRLDKQATGPGNLYLMPDKGQQIKMFNFMAEKFPLVRFSQDIVNTLHLAEMQGERGVVILDIGIGSGQQIARLINQAMLVGIKPEKLAVIGIEPASDSLAQARETLKNLTEKHRIAFRFKEIPKSIEQMTEADWADLEQFVSKEGGKPLFNASFALHHIRPVSIRAELFSRLKKLEPAIFAIIEPYADFLTRGLTERFANAWHHYGLTFGAIDQIDATTEEKNAVKTIFFSREIQDVLAENEARTEQFETGEMWSERLLKAGFSPYSMPRVEREVPSCPFVTVSQNNGYIGLNVEGYPIISIIAGR